MLVVRGTALGLLIEATGVNARASALAGIGTRGMILAVYVWCGLCAALAGIIVAADILGPMPTMPASGSNSTPSSRW